LKKITVSANQEHKAISSIIGTSNATAILSGVSNEQTAEKVTISTTSKLNVVSESETVKT
jgi:hypothetical protein